MRLKTWLPLLLSSLLLTSQAFAAEEKEEKPKNASITVDGAAGYFPLGPTSLGVGLRLEYAFLPFISLIVPLEYRRLAMSSSAESSKFDAFTVGLGARFYFSQLFWKQKMLQGFYAEARVGGGFAFEYLGDVGGKSPSTNKGTTLAISGALGYSHAFDFGLVLGGGLNLSGRAYGSSIQQKGVIGTIPELVLQLGWAF